jgi:hypothetical protein
MPIEIDIRENAAVKPLLEAERRKIEVLQKEKMQAEKEKIQAESVKIESILKSLRNGLSDQLIMEIFDLDLDELKQIKIKM